ncbi:MAG TPA: hypothetical protein IAA26_11045 [Candidatus Blautia faecipullorum]|nr:hypothetical protein [Candidatus Blautia faecipullorum]
MAGYNQYGTCAKCKKQILWIKTKAGKNMPCDTGFVYYKEEAGGKDRIVLPNGQVVTGTIIKESEQADGYGYISHFATCEFSQMFRRKKKRCVG